jgi:hypothetical protein
MLAFQRLRCKPNTGPETGRALFLYTPAGAGKLFEELQLLQSWLPSMDDREMAETFRRYGGRSSGHPHSNPAGLSLGSALSQTPEVFAVRARE